MFVDFKQSFIKEDCNKITSAYTCAQVLNPMESGTMLFAAEMIINSIRSLQNCFFIDEFCETNGIIDYMLS
jgi:hypothetical protein